MFKKVFLDHWIDWAIAIIIMVFIVLIGAVQQYAIEQDSNSASDSGINLVKPNKTQK